MNTLQLELNKYNITIGNNILSHELDSYFHDKEYFLCIDKNVFQLYQDKLALIINNSVDIVIIEALEDNKTFKSLNKIYEMLFTNKANRSQTVLVIGGGLICDIAGYAAATYNRGLDFVSVPTTLLSMVDSSIGGKVAINYNNVKNTIGTFYDPNKVIIDISFLTTLSTRLFKEGFVELLKHGFIKDLSILDDLSLVSNIQELISNKQLIINLIYKSLSVKKYFVLLDPYDKNIRHALNFGHTFAHAIEMSNHKYFHGECVAIGMLLSSALNNNGLNNTYYQYIKNILEKFECLKPLANVDFSKILYDKKNNDKGIKEVLLNNLGEFEITLLPIDQLILMYQELYESIQQKVKTIPICYKISNNNLVGEVIIPPSKSYLHRYLIVSFLHGVNITLNNVYEISDDVQVTINILTSFNSKIVYSNNKLFIDNSNIKKLDNLNANMQESGTSLRLLLPILNYYAKQVNITGSNRLPLRPLDEYLNIMEDNKVKFTISTVANHYLPMNISDRISSDSYFINSNVSSQFISGLLLLMSIQPFESTLYLQEKPQSLPYILMSIDVLNKFNIKVKVNEDYTQYTINNNSAKVLKASFDIEQDYSARTFFEVANSFTNNKIDIKNNVNDSLQADAYLINALFKKEVTFDLMHRPDCANIMALYYSQYSGTLLNTERLKYKESDRLKAIIDMLETAKIDYSIINDNLLIKKGIFNGGFYNTFKDHRVCMSLLIASSIANKDIYLNEILSINKSFPSFVEQFKNLGGIIDEQ
ncbi:iron-containing alcohol dehydrogenase [Mycoplasma sp. P36-A1]|uniref:iron-containing alcohol dehydrogenase n=1 Tax=Mycoplasma sp. P36-A1 TaxID=3252900 RepID=UPI003C30B312